MLPGPGSGPIDPRRLFSPDRQIWTVDRETVLLLGAGRALLLQYAHPLVAARVAEHSTFARDRLGRLRRTLDMSYALVFGTWARPRRPCVGWTPFTRGYAGFCGRRSVDSQPRRNYDAMDPDTSLVVYQRYVTPLTHAQKAEYWADSCAVAQLHGIPESMSSPRGRTSGITSRGR